MRNGGSAQTAFKSDRSNPISWFDRKPRLQSSQSCPISMGNLDPTSWRERERERENANVGEKKGKQPVIEIRSFSKGREGSDVFDETGFTALPAGREQRVPLQSRHAVRKGPRDEDEWWQCATVHRIDHQLVANQTKGKSSSDFEKKYK